MKIKEPEKCSTSEPSNFSAVLAASDSALNQLADSILARRSKFPQAPEQCTPSTLEIHQSGVTCKHSALTEESLTASLVEARVKTSADAAENGELQESDRDCGGRYSPSLTNSPSELSICGNSFKTSGLGISFGKTLPYLPHKRVTRRSWKDNHAKKFINAFNQNKLVKALDKDIRYGGKQIGWCKLLCAPYKEQLAAMPEADLEAEGGMCESVKEFVNQYFKGNSSLEVWVIRFEFIAADKQAQIPTSERLGVYSDSATKADSNSDITSSIESIHQAQLVGCGVYSDSESKAGSNSPITSATDSIHQASFTPLGVYSAIQNRANSNSAITLSTPSIHQALPNHQTVPGVYPNNGNQVNTNAAISSPAESIHQSSTQSLGVYPSNDNQSDSNATNDSLTESIHQALTVQGGSGLVYSFWKGETMVNHYRYKVKINGKWKVRSIYIPVGKLPKVREAIANKSSVTAIVTEVLRRQL